MTGLSVVFPDIALPESPILAKTGQLVLATCLCVSVSLVLSSFPTSSTTL